MTQANDNVAAMTAVPGPDVEELPWLAEASTKTFDRLARSGTKFFRLDQQQSVLMAPMMHKS